MIKIYVKEKYTNQEIIGALITIGGLISLYYVSEGESTTYGIVIALVGGVSSGFYYRQTS